MALLFRSEFLTADFASQYVSSLLLAWIEDDMEEQIVNGIRTKWLVLCLLMLWTGEVGISN